MVYRISKLLFTMVKCTVGYIITMSLVASNKIMVKLNCMFQPKTTSDMSAL